MSARSHFLFIIIVFTIMLLCPVPGICQENESTGPKADPALKQEQPRKALHEEPGQLLDGIFSRKEFWWKHKKPTLANPFMERLAKGIRDFIEWLQNILKKLFPPRHGSPPRANPSLLKWIANFFIIALIAGALYFLYPVVKSLVKTIKEYQAGKGAVLTTRSLEKLLVEDPEVLPQWETLRTKGNDALGRNELRKGIRLFYLALLSYLNDRNVLKYGPGITNTEYLKQIPGNVPMHGDFRSITLTFDRVWYGRAVPESRDVRGYVAICTRILEGAAIEKAH
ncbi:MAG: DUF4129 domain-containing protein [Candidatus Eremiobacteraeota bacterium]|nr:DUF4129 domain-containing protein [Candidatus Eremiobacteraeota bacterium]